jgi:predicted secreted hydrolase
MKLPILGIFAASILIAACGGSATPTTTTGPAPPAPVAEDRVPEPLVFLPKDEAPHDSTVEWWYFNGLLTDDRGNEYSYHYVTFQAQGAGNAVPHLLQASLGDHTAGRHLTGEQIILAALDRDAVGVDVSVDGWVMKGDGKVYDLRFGLADISVDLKAVSTRPPSLHQGVGLVNLGPAGDTFYYSRSRLEVTGSLTVAGEQRGVTGSAWMDHQWGEVVGQRVGWDWMSLQLDDGSDLMAVMVWDPVDRTPFAGYGTLVSPDGPALSLAQDDVFITSQMTWTSPASGIQYPSGWTLRIPSLDLSLDLEPILLDSEFADSRYVPAAYWEGEVRVTGTRQGQTIGGRGFVELVGYDPRQVDGATTSP